MRSTRHPRQSWRGLPQAGPARRRHRRIPYRPRHPTQPRLCPRRPRLLRARPPRRGADRAGAAGRRAAVMRSRAAAGGGLPLEELQPAEHHGVARSSSTGAAPPAACPSRSRSSPAACSFESSMNSLQLLRRALQRERLLDHHRLADREALQRLQRLVDLARLRVEVDARRSRARRRPSPGTKPEVSPWPVQAPVHQADGDEVPLVVPCGSAATRCSTHCRAIVGPRPVLPGRA